jgi:predicted TIM-barrel fold metal-dependent hydrolase
MDRLEPHEDPELTARERVRSYLAHLSAEDQAKVFGGTAARIFGFVSR